MDISKVAEVLYRMQGGGKSRIAGPSSLGIARRFSLIRHEITGPIRGGGG